MRPGRADLAAICAYLVLGVWVLAEYWVDVDHRISAHTPLDQTWFEWLLAHAVYTVRHLENPLFSLRQNAPLGVNLMANTSALAITLPLSPITIVFGPSVSYAVWVSGGTAATAAATYWVLSRHVVTSRAAAFLGGGLVGFAPGVIHHANGQPVFVANFLLPFIAVRAVRLGTTGRWLREGITLGLLVAWQLFINEELLLLTALALRGRRGGVRSVRVAPRTGAAAPVLRRGRRHGGRRGCVHRVCDLVPVFRAPDFPRLERPILYAWGEDLQSFVTFSRDTLAGSAAVEETLGRTEQNSWFGWPLCALLVLSSTALWRRSPSARTAAIVALVFLPLSLGRTIRVGTAIRESPVSGPRCRPVCRSSRWSWCRDSRS
jgi:hypothetical protein